MQKLMRRPLVGLCVLMVLGTGLGLTCNVPASVILGLAIIATGVAILLALRCHSLSNSETPVLSAVHIPLGLAIIVLAWINAALRTPQELTLPSAWQTEPCPTVAITGIITEDPVCTSAATKPFQKWTFSLAMESASQENRQDLPLAGTVQIYWTCSRFCTAPPRYGERWKFSGRFTPVKHAYSKKFRNKNPRFFASQRASEFISDGHGSWLLTKCYAARKTAAHRLALGIANYPDAVRVIHSLLLGYRRQMSWETYQTFAATGTVHIFAISGSHIIVIAALIITLLNACGMMRTRWILILGPALILFTLATGMEPSAVRACIMAVVYWTAPLLHRRSDIYSTLGLSAILILAVQPQDLTNPGFILSFTAVLGLALFYPPLIGRIEPLLAVDPLRLQPEPRWRHYLRGGALETTKLLTASAAAWLVSAPFTAWYFGLFSPIALLGNLIALPVSFLIMTAGGLSLVLGLVADELAVIFNSANVVLSLFLVKSMDVLAAIPGSHFKVPSPPLWGLIAMVLALALFAWWLNLHHVQKATTDLEG